MKISLLIHASPTEHASSMTALRFAKAALAKGHEIYRVFFYMDAVWLASQLSVLPQDEASQLELWAQLSRDHECDLVVCIAAALRRGVLDETESKRYRKHAANLPSEFTLSGLGQMVECCALSDRVVSFGS